jgi:hypothetical protein
MEDAGMTKLPENLSRDEILAIGWGSKRPIGEIAAYLGIKVSEVAMRRHQIGLPDRDHKGNLKDTITHPFDWDGVKVQKTGLSSSLA